MKSSTDVKKRIDDIEAKLAQARTATDELPVAAGKAAADGDDRKADQLFAEAEKAAMLVKRYEATLAELRTQYNTAVAAEKESERVAKVEALNADTDATIARLSKKLIELKRVWNETIEISAQSPELNRLNGKRILQALFSKSFKGGAGASLGLSTPADVMTVEVDETLQALDRVTRGDIIRRYGEVAG